MFCHSGTTIWDLFFNFLWLPGQKSTFPFLSSFLFFHWQLGTFDGFTGQLCYLASSKSYTGDVMDVWFYPCMFLFPLFPLYPVIPPFGFCFLAYNMQWWPDESAHQNMKISWQSLLEGRKTLNKNQIIYGSFNTITENLFIVGVSSPGDERNF